MYQPRLPYSTLTKTDSLFNQFFLSIRHLFVATKVISMANYCIVIAVTFLTAFMMLTPTTFATVNQPNQSDIFRITELFFAGGNLETCADCSREKWIEITNTTQQAANIEGYKLQIGTDSSNIFVFGNYTIPPHSAILITSKYGDTGQSINGYSPQSIIATGRMNSLSRMSTAPYHITVTLLNPTNASIQSIRYGQSEVDAITSSIPVNFTSSIEIGANNQWSLPQNIYFPNHYGNPLITPEYLGVLKYGTPVHVTQFVAEENTTLTSQVEPQITIPESIPTTESVIVSQTDENLATAPAQEIIKQPQAANNLNEGAILTKEVEQLIPNIERIDQKSQAHQPLLESNPITRLSVSNKDDATKPRQISNNPIHQNSGIFARIAQLFSRYGIDKLFENTQHTHYQAANSVDYMNSSSSVIQQNTETVVSSNFISEFTSSKKSVFQSLSYIVILILLYISRKIINSSFMEFAIDKTRNHTANNGLISHYLM